MEEKTEKKEKIPPSKNQQRAIDELGNVVVSAGAGSGKTRVLSFRFAKMVEKDGTQADRILTLTFTNKSAVEMKQRIFKQLCDDLNDDSISDEEKNRAKVAIQNFDKTHIQTLDSYFSDIVRSGAHFYGITPSFSIDADKINSLVLTKAYQFVLSHNQNFAIQALTREFKFEEIAEKVFAETILNHSSIISESKFSDKIQVQRDKIKEVWKKYSLEADNAVSVATNLSIDDKNFSDTDKKNLEALDDLSKKTQITNTIAQEDFWEKIDDEKIKEINDYLSYLGLWTKAFSRLAPKKFPELYELLFGQDKKGGLYDTINRLNCAANYICNFKISEEILRLLDEFDVEVQDTKRTSGILVFDDVSKLAFDILKNHSDIRHIEQEKFDRIMIDEFQDNNQLQCDVLFMLSDVKEKFVDSKYIVPTFKSEDASKEAAEEVRSRLAPQKLFFVGDEKQSIYRFRNADVSVFRSLQENLRGENFEDDTDENPKNFIYLETNYRSMPNLVNGFNFIFGGNNEKNEPSALMKKEDGENIPEYEAEYLKVEFAQEKLKEENQEKRIHIALYNTGKKGDSDYSDNDDSKNEIEASYVAKKIQELHQNGVNYSDIALLFKSTTQFRAYEDELLKAHIPHSTEVFKGFFSDGPVNDIVSFLRVCVYPEDINSISKLLCSPFVNLSKEEMEIFMSLVKHKKEELRKLKEEQETQVSKDEENQKKIKTAIYPYGEHFMEIAKSLFGEDSISFKKILNAKNDFETLKYSIKNKSIAEVVSMLWYEFGYRYETLWNKDVQMFSNLYDIFFELARRSDENAQSLVSFLDEIENFNNDTAKIEGLDIPFETEDSVKILTIHKSKGLEYKVVFVCAANAGKGNFPDPCAFTKDYGLVVRLPEIPCVNNIKNQGDGDFVTTSTKNYFILENKITEDKEEAAELRRVTYVAFTRAIDELFIVGSFSGIDPKNKALLKDNTETVSKAPNNIYQSILTVLNKYLELENPADKDSRKCVLKKDAKVPFTYEEFYEKYSYQFQNNENFVPNVDSEKNSFALNKEYSENVIQKDYLRPVHLNPSGLEKYIAEDENFVAPMKEIDELVESTILGKDWYDNWNNEHPDNPKSPKPRFSYADFGSVAHAYLEEKINSQIEQRDFEPKLPEKMFLGLDIDSKRTKDKKSADVYEENKQKLDAICRKMVDNFSETNLFKEICASEWKKTEYAFRLSRATQKNEVVISGMMDLVFKNAPDSKYKFTIVDYKTNKQQISEKYFGQLASYRLAIAEMKGVDFEEVRCVLYFLRYDSKTAECDVSDFCTLQALDSSINRYLTIDSNRFQKSGVYSNLISSEELAEEAESVSSEDKSILSEDIDDFSEEEEKYYSEEFVDE